MAGYLGRRFMTGFASLFSSSPRAAYPGSGHVTASLDEKIELDEAYKRDLRRTQAYRRAFEATIGWTSRGLDPFSPGTLSRGLLDFIAQLPPEDISVRRSEPESLVTRGDVVDAISRCDRDLADMRAMRESHGKGYMITEGMRDAYLLAMEDADRFAADIARSAETAMHTRGTISFNPSRNFYGVPRDYPLLNDAEVAETLANYGLKTGAMLDSASRNKNNIIKGE